jgi:hypothetical protein
MRLQTNSSGAWMIVSCRAEAGAWGSMSIAQEYAKEGGFNGFSGARGMAGRIVRGPSTALRLLRMTERGRQVRRSFGCGWRLRSG